MKLSPGEDLEEVLVRADVAYHNVGLTDEQKFVFLSKSALVGSIQQFVVLNAARTYNSLINTLRED